MKTLAIFATLVVVITARTTHGPSTLCEVGCTCKNYQEVLSISDCEFPITLTKEVFQNFNHRKINAVFLKNSSITQVNNDAFSNFINLNDVVINKCNIGSIEENAFGAVKTLKFDDCKFNQSPDLVSDKLEELHFGNCRLIESPNFNKLPALTFLNLTMNNLKHMDVATFANLFNLDQLHLSDNHIFKLPPDLFINNLNLTTLFIDKNPLKSIYINTPNNLQTLSLKSCMLTSFSLPYLKTISELYLNENQISSLAVDSFEHMPELQTIDLSSNKLEAIDSRIFYKNRELQNIMLNNNNLKTLPKFELKDSNFPAYHFSCYNCNLTTLSEDVFINMPALSVLRLSKNHIENIDNMFSKLLNLKFLDVSYNYITSIGPNTFKHTKNLEYLNLAGNVIKSLNPDVFAENHVLHEINARNTQLDKLWSNHHTIINSLKTLDVSNNNLEELTKEDFKLIPELTSIDVRNNLFKDSSDMCKMANWLEQYSKVYPVTYDPDSMRDTLRGDNLNQYSIFNKKWAHVFDIQCLDITDEDINDPKSTDDYNESDYEDEIKEEKVILEDGNSDRMMKARPDVLQASDVLSVVLVFIVSALVFLSLTVTLILFILRRNSSFNMQKANLPRFKIPLWDTQASQKKHSGSIYRPLSEDLSGPKTPKLSRYEFTQTPTVHTPHN